MAVDEVNAGWVRRVLGVGIGPAGAPAARPNLLPIWVAAKEEVDDGLSALQAKLRASEREGLRLIGEYGLSGLTDAQGVPMMVGVKVPIMATFRDALGKIEQQLSR